MFFSVVGVVCVVLCVVASSLYDMRICGVLQRLAATYFVVALTEVLTSQLYKRKSVSVCECVCCL